METPLLKMVVVRLLKETQNHQPPCYNKYKKITKRRSLRSAYSL